LSGRDMYGGSALGAAPKLWLPRTPPREDRPRQIGRRRRRASRQLHEKQGSDPAGSDPSRSVLAPLAVAAATAAASTPPVAVAATWPLLGPLARRRVLRPLDQLLRRHRAAVLVLLDRLQADAATRLVDLLHDHVEDVAAVDHVFDVTDPARAHVRDVQQAVRPLLQLHERAE